jgi:hypothetical protein
MGLVPGTDNGNNAHLYEAAREAKDKGKDPLAAAKTAAESDGKVTGLEQSFLDNLKIDPGYINLNDDLKVNTPNYNTDKTVGKNIEFVENKEPSLNEMKDNFKKEFGGTSGSYLEPNNPQLISKLTKVAKALDSDPKSTEKLTGYAINMAVNVAHPDNEDLEATYAENRTKDMLLVFDKVKQNKPLTSDDIQSLQLFIFMDTEHGRMLHDKDGENGIDGKFGPRTNSAFDLFLKEQNII